MLHRLRSMRTRGEDGTTVGAGKREGEPGEEAGGLLSLTSSGRGWLGGIGGLGGKPTCMVTRASANTVTAVSLGLLGRVHAPGSCLSRPPPCTRGPRPLTRCVSVPLTFTYPGVRPCLRQSVTMHGPKSRDDLV